jgi:hypothetical protein
MALVDALARHTDEPGRLTRLYLSPAHRATAEATLTMMRQAGLEARIDAVGNVIGRREGRERGAPALIIGSHLDSVVDAGRFDGPPGSSPASSRPRRSPAKAPCPSRSKSRRSATRRMSASRRTCRPPTRLPAATAPNGSTPARAMASPCAMRS